MNCMMVVDGIDWYDWVDEHYDVVNGYDMSLGTTGWTGTMGSIALMGQKVQPGGRA